MTKMHEVENAARLAMAGFPDFDAPQVARKAGPLVRLSWLVAVGVVLGGTGMLWLVT